MRYTHIAGPAVDQAMPVLDDTNRSNYTEITQEDGAAKATYGGRITGKSAQNRGKAWCGRRDSNPHWDTQADFKSAASTIPPRPQGLNSWVLAEGGICGKRDGRAAPP